MWAKKKTTLKWTTFINSKVIFTYQTVTEHFPVKDVEKSSHIWSGWRWLFFVVNQVDWLCCGKGQRDYCYYSEIIPLYGVAIDSFEVHADPHTDEINSRLIITLILCLKRQNEVEVAYQQWARVCENSVWVCEGTDGPVKQGSHVTNAPFLCFILSISLPIMLILMTFVSNIKTQLDFGFCGKQ